jgi:3-oxoacyl-(acyl-carrier-protein) synthase
MTRRDCRVARAVVTGIGLVTPLGGNLDEVWQGLLAGRSGIRRIQAFNTEGIPCQIGGEITDFSPEQFIPAKEARRMSRASQMALVAAHRAVADAALPIPLTWPRPTPSCWPRPCPTCRRSTSPRSSALTARIAP